MHEPSRAVRGSTLCIASCTCGQHLCTPPCPTHLAEHQLDAAKDGNPLLQGHTGLWVERAVERLRRWWRAEGAAWLVCSMSQVRPDRVGEVSIKQPMMAHRVVRCGVRWCHGLADERRTGAPDKPAQLLPKNLSNAPSLRCPPRCPGSRCCPGWQSAGRR